MFGLIFRDRVSSWVIWEGFSVYLLLMEPPQVSAFEVQASFQGKAYRFKHVVTMESS